MTAFEHFALDTYDLVKKHSLFTEHTEEELAHFAEDEVELTLITDVLLDNDEDTDDTDEASAPVEAVVEDTVGDAVEDTVDSVVEGSVDA